MRSIFISYRRNDSEGESGRLFDDLVREFGEDSVFMDVAAIEAGRDFRKAIDESVATCGVLLAVIGKNWVDAKDDTGRRRLDDPMDFVRLETASALKRDIPVIPIIVRGAAMPRPEQLPDDLKDLAYRNFLELTHARWSSDLQLLITALQRRLSGHKSEPLPAVSDVEIKKEPSPPPMPAEVERAQPAGAVASGERAERATKPKWLPVAIAALCVVAAIAAYLLWPRQVTVPNVRGKALAEATSLLQGAHLEVGKTSTREDANKDANVVLSQYPPSDEQVRRGTAIDLVVAAAATQVEVPALTGQSLESAQRMLADSKLNVGEVEKQSRAGVAAGLVLQEFPKPGEMVRSGAKIDLLISDAPPQPGAVAAPANAKSANEKWAAQRAQAKQAAAAKAAVAVEQAAANVATTNQAIIDKTAPAKTDQPAAATPWVRIRSASCTTLQPGQYKVDLAGDAYAPAGDTYLFYVWVAVGDNGTRWRPTCSSWSVPQAGEDPLADVTCIHRPNDAPQTSWQTSRTINIQTKQAPTSGGTSIVKAGSKTPSNLKFNFTCQ